MSDEINNKPGRPKGSTREDGFMSSKMTKAEVEDFLSHSTRIIFEQHLSWTEYVRWARKQGISKAQANVYWKRVWKRVREKYKLEKDNLISKHLLKYWNIHDKAMTNNDLNTARQALNDISKLLGLNEPEKLDVNNSGTIQFKFGDE